MQLNTYIYSFGYNETEKALCQLESKYIFKKAEKNRVLLSETKVEPSISAFIKNRLDVITLSEDYDRLINKIKNEKIGVEGFKVEYLVFDSDTTVYADRLDKLRDIGFSIEGEPDYYKPRISYGLGYYEGVWYFGVLVKDDFVWYKHRQKPYSYSNSISTNIAKALVNIAAEADKKKSLLDALCGVGTIMLEACFAGYNIEGCDINWKICRDARENLKQFGYAAKVFCSDVKAIRKNYDAAILDLPYNLLSDSTDKDTLYLMEATAEITNRVVIVSTADISQMINKAGFSIQDHCSVRKKGKKSFARRIWVCNKGK